MTNPINIDLWFWRLDAPARTIDRWQGYLNVAERTRRDRFLFEKDQTRFTICRSRMRRILARYMSMSPRDIEFATSGRDKPVLASANPRGVHFNLTHTDGLACLAVAHGLSVGVDLEHVRAIEDDFIAYALNPAELAIVLSQAATDRRRAFFHFWTAKEAYLKSIGTGLWQSLKTFDVDLPLNSAPGEFARGTLPRIDDEGDRARNWHLYTFRAAEHHIGALALAPPDGATVEIRTRSIR